MQQNARCTLLSFEAKFSPLVQSLALICRFLMSLISISIHYQHLLRLLQLVRTSRTYVADRQLCPVWRIRQYHWVEIDRVSYLVVKA